MESIKKYHQRLPQCADLGVAQRSELNARSSDRAEGEILVLFGKDQSVPNFWWLNCIPPTSVSHLSWSQGHR
jgi:hypothetical protein